MPKSTSWSRGTLARAACILIFASGCGGGGGGGVVGSGNTDVAGQWAVLPVVTGDACAISGLLGFNAPATLSITQTGATLVVEQRAVQGSSAVIAGTGSVSGTLVSITYDYGHQIDLGGSDPCMVDIHLTVDGTVAGDRFDGVAGASTSYNGDNIATCSHFDGCSVSMSIGATRCPATGCP